MESKDNILTSGFPHEILIELIGLREKKDFSALMYKLYEAFEGPFNYIFDHSNLSPELLTTLSMMINYFQEKEEYEKCAVLKKLMKTVN